MKEKCFQIKEKKKCVKVEADEKIFPNDVTSLK